MNRWAPRLLVPIALALAGLAIARSGDAGPPPAWRAAEHSLVKRSEVGAARIADKIYVVGGYRAPGGATTGALESYDVSSGTWKRRRSLPIAVNHPAVTSAGGRLYVNGGFQAAGQQQASARLYSYSPERNRWRRLPNSPIARAAHALQAIRGNLYAAGGANGSSRQIRALFVYDLSARVWRRGPRMRVGRNHVASAVLNGKLYVIGGRPGPEAGNRRVVERFDPATGRWRTVAPLEVATSGAAAAVARGEVVVFGGEKQDGSRETVGATEAYDPATGSWTGLPDMLTPRHGLGGASLGDRVFALEGGAVGGLHFSTANEYLRVP
jgi:N-acetylneuraminic acid mutarotase